MLIHTIWWKSKTSRYNKSKEDLRIEYESLRTLVSSHKPFYVVYKESTPYLNENKIKQSELFKEQPDKKRVLYNTQKESNKRLKIALDNNISKNISIQSVGENPYNDLEYVKSRTITKDDYLYNNKFNVYGLYMKILHLLENENFNNSDTLSILEYESKQV